jgi:hydrogenase maturation protease
MGVGNPLRGDDGAGIEVLRRLRNLLDGDRVEFVEVAGDGTELMSAWDGFRSVYIFDAMMSRGEPGRLHRFEATAQAIPFDRFKYSSHAFGLAEAIELGKALGKLPQKVIVYGIEGSNFGRGERITDPVMNGVAQVVSRVQHEMREDLRAIPD